MDATCWVGIDVSKDTLDIAWSDDPERTRQVTNDARGFRQLLRWLGMKPAAGIVAESTGMQHIDLVQALQDAGQPIAVVPPQRPRHFRKGLHKYKAKTDAVDAKLLAAYGATDMPAPIRVWTAAERRLRELVGRREDAIVVLNAEKNRLPGVRDPFVIASLEASIAFHRAQVALLDAEIDDVIAGDPLLKERRRRLQTMRGVGPVCSATLLAYMPELGELNRREIASLAGLAPYNNQSGKSDQGGHCRGGRAPVRRVLYLAAHTLVTNSRIEETPYRAEYAELHASKGHKRTVTAIARRMLVLLNAMIRDELDWQETDIAQGKHNRPSQLKTPTAA